MTLLKILKEELEKARKDRNKIAVNILGVVLGEIQNISVGKELTEDDELNIIKKTIKSNNITIKAALEEGRTADEVLDQENSILGKFLPQEMTVEQIKQFMVEENIELDANTGKSMGIVIKALKKAGHSFNSNNVKEAIAK